MMEAEVAVRLAIVEDHKIFRDGLSILLNKLPNVEVAGEYENGEQAVNGIKSNPVDVVLMDLKMPIMDGHQATAAIVSHVPGAKVIALSSFGEQSQVLQMVTAGARGYLLKNVSREELALAIKEVHSGRLYFTAELNYTPFRPLLHENDSSNLSDREREVVQLICQGKTNKEISEALFISKRTVDGHRERIMQKTGCRHVLELFLYAIRHQIYRLVQSSFA